MAASLGRLLVELRRAGVSIALKEGDIVCRARHGPITQEQINAIQRAKQDLVRYLAAREQIPRSVTRQATPSQVPLGEGQYLRLEWARDCLANGWHSLDGIGSLTVPRTGNLTALRKAILDVIRRHDVFRSRLRKHEDNFVLDVNKDSIGTIESSIFHYCEDDDVDRESAQFLTQTYDPDDAPLAQIRVVISNCKGAYILFWINPVIADGWSLWVVRRDFGAFYDAHRLGYDSGLAPLPLQFSDYLLWKQRMRNITAAVQGPFWRYELKGCRPAVVTDVIRMESVSCGSVRIAQFDMDPALRLRIEALSRQGHWTPFVIHYAAFLVALARLTGSNDLVTGLIGGRAMPELYDTVALCAHCAPIRLIGLLEMSLPMTLEKLKEKCSNVNHYTYPHLENLSKILEFRCRIDDIQFHYNPWPASNLTLNAQKPYFSLKENHGQSLVYSMIESLRFTVLDFGRNGVVCTLVWNDAMLDTDFVKALIDGFIRVISKELTDVR